jgi:hypothetical protein
VTQALCNIAIRPSRFAVIGGTLGVGRLSAAGACVAGMHAKRDALEHVPPIPVNAGDSIRSWRSTT